MRVLQFGVVYSTAPGLPDSLHLEAPVQSGLPGQREKLQKMRSVFEQDWAGWLTDWYDTSDITLSFTRYLHFIIFRSGFFYTFYKLENIWINMKIF